MNLPENENPENENNLNNQPQDDQEQDNKSQNEPNEEMNDQQQSQTSEEPSEFSGVINASMGGTTEQQPLAQAYDAATPSFELESEENRINEGGDEEE